MVGSTFATQDLASRVDFVRIAQPLKNRVDNAASPQRSVVIIVVQLNPRKTTLGAVVLGCLWLDCAALRHRLLPVRALGMLSHRYHRQHTHFRIR
jgi:hypothetical protein